MDPMNFIFTRNSPPDSTPNIAFSESLERNNYEEYIEPQFIPSTSQGISATRRNLFNLVFQHKNPFLPEKEDQILKMKTRNSLQEHVTFYLTLQMKMLIQKIMGML